MTCDDIRPRLTAYLDGELEGDRGTVVRGHLRSCEACRRIASDEATLRDALRALPTVDPPPSLWTNIQGALAAAEVAESNRPAWKRALARWRPAVPRFALGGLAIATAATVLWVRAQPAADPTPDAKLVAHPSPVIQPMHEDARPPAPPPASAIAPSPDDVTAALAAEPARTTETYAQTARELLALADEARPGWTPAQQAAFDAALVELRAAVDGAAEGRPRQRAYRAMIRYVQGAVIRDEVALASGGAR